jgi:hypothetical protein
MNNEIELISDGEGLAVIGDAASVEQFLASEGLTPTKPDQPNVGAALMKLATAAQAGATIATAMAPASSARWVKLTKESAAAVDKHGLMSSKSTPGVSYAMVGKPGKIKEWIQIDKVGSKLNPATFASAGALMSQIAMQQQMDEIHDYLVIINEKLDDVLRAQMNQVLAQMDGVDLAIKDAMSVRDAVGRVSEVTWSKVQASAQSIHETQGFALRQLADLADKIEGKARVDEIVKVARLAEADVPKWLSVLARCFQLHDAVAVLELDRVLDAAPDELDRHRVGLQAARRDRVDLFVQGAERLLVRMEAAASTANSKVLFNPIQSPAVIKASNSVVEGVGEFHGLLEVEASSQSAEARQWKHAASESWDTTFERGVAGIGTVKSFGGDTFSHAKSATGKLSGNLSGRKLRRRGNDAPVEGGD